MTQQGHGLEKLPLPKKGDILTEVTEYGWLKPKIDRGYGKDQYTLWDLDNFVFPHCKQRRTAVQAGGGIGMWPARMAEFFQNVYTFEPNPELFHCLARNCPERNIHKFQAALGNRKELVDMSWGFSRNNYGGYYVTGEGPIPTLRIDDLGLKDVDLIMVDIEGKELHALMGAEKTILRDMPTIVFESKAATAMKFGWKIDDLREWLRLRNYKHVVSFHSNKDELWMPR